MSPIKSKKCQFPIYDSIINKDKEENGNKPRISLYKRSKIQEIKKKNEENEQIILRDLNRKIKSIYDVFKNK